MEKKQTVSILRLGAYGPSNKTGTRQYTRAVWSTFANIYSTHPPRFIDALSEVTGISG